MTGMKQLTPCLLYNWQCQAVSEERDQANSGTTACTPPTTITRPTHSMIGGCHSGVTVWAPCRTIQHSLLPIKLATIITNKSDRTDSHGNVPSFLMTCTVMTTSKKFCLSCTSKTWHCSNWLVILYRYQGGSSIVCDGLKFGILCWRGYSSVQSLRCVMCSRAITISTPTLQPVQLSFFVNNVTTRSLYNILVNSKIFHFQLLDLRQWCEHAAV